MGDERLPQFEAPKTDENYTIGVDPAYPGDDAPFFSRMEWVGSVMYHARAKAYREKDWRTYYTLIDGDPFSPLFSKIEAWIWLWRHRKDGK